MSKTTNKTELIAATPQYRQAVAKIKGYLAAALTLIKQPQDAVQVLDGDRDMADCLIVLLPDSTPLVKFVLNFEGEHLKVSELGALVGVEVYVWSLEYWCYQRYVAADEAEALPRYFVSNLLNAQFHAIVLQNPL